MAPAVVYQQAAEGAGLERGELFAGKRFWVAQHVPHRAALLHLIKANGGSVVQLEKLAHWRIADHFRRDCPPGSVSYDFVHKSIARAAIQDPSDFPAGPRMGTARDPGSMLRPAKATRAAFTPDEDRMLYKWAKDAQASHLPLSGNELYKELEEKYPRHTWQSWRDRYLKRLQYLPASTFDVPDDAPPSPPLPKKTAPGENKDSARAAAAEDQPASMGASASREVYTVDQLAATFTTEDWEHLYAFVQEIDSCTKEDQSYDAAWKNWANSKDNQTPEQWRQYYEKVVRPQWLLDPVSKREQIKKKVEETVQNDSSSPTKTQSWSQAQDAVGASQPADMATTRPSSPPKCTLSNTIPSDSKLASESTAQQETPTYIRDGYESALKRIRGELDDPPDPTETTRPTKVRRRASMSPTLVEPEELADVGTQKQPLDISSVPSSQQPYVEQSMPEDDARTQTPHSASQIVNEEDEVESLASKDDFARIHTLPRPPVVPDDADEDVESIASSTDLAHIVPLPRPTRIPEDEDDDDHLPSNTPTPRVNKFAAFDTQAILSPSQMSTSISKLPRPLLGSSPPHHPESEASTTQSLQEFSSYLKDNDQDDRAQTQAQTTRPLRPASPTPSATSSISSTGSGDPDEPLAADEMEEFFAEQRGEGHSDEAITKALKRTRFRPGLAMAVLEAWQRGDALPSQRGIWSEEDDEMVESGDGAALARLERKHTLDGWGGITERMNFLTAWERR